LSAAAAVAEHSSTSLLRSAILRLNIKPIDLMLVR